jgi:hypothetical protein
MKKLSKKSPKFILDRQVIRDLKIVSPEALGQVQGATNDPMCSLCQDNSCLPQ